MGNKLASNIARKLKISESLKAVWNDAEFHSEQARKIKAGKGSKKARAAASESSKKMHAEMSEEIKKERSRKISESACRRAANGLLNVKTYRGYYGALRFDSSLELSFIIEQKLLNNVIERCSLQIPYHDGSGNLHRYNPDFVVNGKTIVEIKGRHWDSELAKHKKQAIEYYCLQNNLKFLYLPQSKKLATLSKAFIENLLNSEIITLTARP